MTTIENLTQDLCNTATEILKAEENYKHNLSIIDREISDIYHLIEFSNLNAAEGYKMYRELKSILVKRRAIKNDLKRINDLRTNMSSIDKIKEACIISDINVNNQNYTPRIREDLFDFIASDFTIDKTIRSSNIAQTYLNKPIRVDSKYKHYTFNNLKEAMEFTISISNFHNPSQDTYKKIAKKIITACLENSRYLNYKWAFIN